jgi:hypothetical protein
MLSKPSQSRRFQIAALLALLPGAVVCNIASAQATDGRALPRLVSKKEGEAVAQAALHHWPQMRDKPDCSHLVHDVYTEVGLKYEYATTNDIFDGIESFERVSQPQAGDLVVWQGHVGIVIDPEDHSFYSSVITGFSVSSFSSSYWESRGPRRFYRYKISQAQSVRLLQRTSHRKPYAAVTRPVVKEPSYIAEKKNLEDDSTEAEPDLPDRGVIRESGPKETGSVALKESRVAGAVVTAIRRPIKEEVRSAFVRLSDANAAQWQQSVALDDPIEIVDGFEAGRFETQGSSGWAELKVTTIAFFADGRMHTTRRTMKVRFTLLRQADGWTLQAPANHYYLLRTAAVRMITARLAMLARDPDNAKELKDLHKALGILLAENRS